MSIPWTPPSNSQESLATGLPTVTVVVPHYNDLAGLAACLAALKNQRYPKDLISIVVADNNSSFSRQVIESAIEGRARLAIVEERGAGPARNGGAALAQGEILAFTDCDCVPDVDWLLRGVEALSNFDLVGGQMIVTVKDLNRLTAAEAFEKVFAFNNKRYIEKKGFTVTANLFSRITTFQAVGGFGVGMSEDVDWCHRARDAGFKLGYCPEAICSHPARRNWDELRSKWARINREDFILTTGSGLGRFRYFLRTMLLPLSVLPHAFRVVTTRKLTGGRAKSLAIQMLARLRLWRFFNSLSLLTNSG